MLEVKIPKEIMEYREKFLMGLSIRQFVCLLFASVASAACYIFTAYAAGLSDGLAGYVAMAASMPFLAVGFIKVEGYNFEKFAKVMASYAFGEKVLVYRNSDSDAVLEENYARSEKRAGKAHKEADLERVFFTSDKKWRRRSRRRSKAAVSFRHHKEKKPKSGKVGSASYKV